MANAMMAEFWEHQRAKEKEPDCEERQVGALQLLSSIQMRHDKPKSRGLMFVTATINGRSTKAMVDTGATHNFITMQEATRLGLKVQERMGMVKAVNSQANPILGMVRNVPISMGGWSGKITASVVHMDDFKLVLGMDFFDQAKATTLPFANALYIMDGGDMRMVPIERATRDNSEVLSALQCTLHRSKKRRSHKRCTSNQPNTQAKPQRQNAQRQQNSTTRPSKKARRGRRDLGGGECHGTRVPKEVRVGIGGQQAQNATHKVVQVPGSFRKTPECSPGIQNCPHCA